MDCRLQKSICLYLKVQLRPFFDVLTSLLYLHIILSRSISYSCSLAFYLSLALYLIASISIYLSLYWRLFLLPSLSLYHSLIEIVWPLQLKSHCYCFCLHREFYNTAIDGIHKDKKNCLTYWGNTIVSFKGIVNFTK